MKTILQIFRDKIEISKKPARFVPKTKCWLWQGYKNPRGYGEVSWQGRCWSVHRLSFTLRNGQIPNEKGIMVCHTCDEKLCCNPKHLFLGDGDSNQLDRIKKLVQMTPEQIQEILESPLSDKILAKRFGIRVENVRHIRIRKYSEIEYRALKLHKHLSGDQWISTIQRLSGERRR